MTTQLIRLLEGGVDLSGPRAVLVGGGPVPVSTIRALAEDGPHLIDVVLSGAR